MKTRYFSVILDSQTVVFLSNLWKDKGEKWLRRKNQTGTRQIWTPIFTTCRLFASHRARNWVTRRELTKTKTVNGVCPLGEEINILTSNGWKTNAPIRGVNSDLGIQKLKKSILSPDGVRLKILKKGIIIIAIGKIITIFLHGKVERMTLEVRSGSPGTDFGQHHFVFRQN